MAMASIHKSNIPAASILNGTYKQYDYADSYSSVIELSPGQTVSIEDVAKAFFTSGPRWVEDLFALRNRSVGWLGLKTGGAANRQQLIDNFTCEAGAKLGLFKVFAKNAQEVVLGEDDKHLNFRVSLFLAESSNQHDRELIISTVVVFHNWFGRLYFLPVKQFHRLIVQAMLKGVVRQLQR